MNCPSEPRRRIFRTGRAAPDRQRPYRPALECLEDRQLLSGGFAQVNLASDVPGLARVTDPNLVNPWGVAYSPTGPFWFADNGSGVSDLLDGRGQPVPLVVTVPSALRSGGTPTGTVFNGGAGFAVSENGVSAPSRFLFATADGTISGWTDVVDRTRALLAVDNSPSGVVYTGLALAADPAGHSFLYAADFSRGTIDVFDQDFRPVVLPGSFQDPNLPDGFAPFNIQNINDLLFVTYAQQDEGRREDVAGAGHGFIDVYGTDGRLVRRFASQGSLNSPWGLALAPADFGRFGGALLVGNNGDGRINAYDPRSGIFLGELAGDNGVPIAVPNLWALTFGNGHAGGASDTLFFTAGLDDEGHGLFGAIQAPQRRGANTAGPGTFDPHAPGEPGDYPLPPSGGPALQDGDEDSPPATAVLLPLTESSLVLVPTLSTVPQPRARAEAPAPLTPSVVASFQGPIGTARLVPSTLVSPLAGDLLPPKNAHANSLALSAFLDLNVAQTLPENPSRGQRPDTNLATIDDLSSPSGSSDAEAESPLVEPHIQSLEARSGAEQSPDSPPPPGQADEVLAPVPPEGRSELAGSRTAGNEGVKTHERGNWSELLTSLLVAVSMTAIYSIWRGLQSTSRQASGKDARADPATRCSNSSPWLCVLSVIADRQARNRAARGLKRKKRVAARGSEKAPPTMAKTPSRFTVRPR